MLIRELLHPDYHNDEYVKWRLTYQGGRKFIQSYLEKFSSRESDDDFATRKKITYNPAFAKANVNEVRDSIFQRMTDIVRLDGPNSYQNALNGENKGVDRVGSSMNSFIGTTVLPEMATMRKVGIFVDRDRNIGNTFADSYKKIPYVYYYPAEAIRSWVYDDNGNLTKVFLEDSQYTYFADLPTQISYRFRKLELMEKADRIQVRVTWYDADQVISDSLTPLEESWIDIPEIPLVIGQLSDSLLTDIADYQIALMNIASSDLGYILKSNYPFYTEQFNPNAENSHLKQADDQKEIQVGTTQGRRYPLGTERPDFINPSPEPLKVSMEKQEQMKEEMRVLLKLTISNLTASTSKSAASKAMDERSLESGLSYIGLELEFIERQIARFWTMYEDRVNFEAKIPQINYPECYSLRSEEDVNTEITSLLTITSKTNCLEFKKKMLKRLVQLTLGNKISRTDLNKIYTRIDEYTVIDEPANIIADMEAGLLDKQTVADNKDYPKGVVEKADAEQVDRLEKIALSQAKGQGAGAAANPSARGIKEGSVTPKKDASQEKKDNYQ